ncbi:MAG: cupin domain-containing protein [Oscillospiraceae bacterium]|nr:cupin domain-containing protein [Oscillospiraceae bacterium]
MNISEQIIADIVKKVIESIGDNGEFEKNRDPSGVMSVRTSTVKPDVFDTGKPGDKVFLKDVSSLEECPRVGAGVMEMDHSDFDWTLRYDEWDFVIDGTLEIVIDGRRVVGNKGDMIYIPANSSITFSCPTTCRFAYFVYPADWSNQ